jgi:amidohydrolase
MSIKVFGSQSHGAAPWMGVDPIVTSAQIIMGLQTIVSRNMKLTKNAAVITIGKIEGGVRSNIIPDKVEMEGTIRALDPEMQAQLHTRIREVATGIAESAGARVEVVIHDGYPVTYNDPDLVAQMLPSLSSSAGSENVRLIDAVTGAEDFSFFAREVPGFFFFLGGRPLNVAPEDAPSHHRPDFFVDESGMKLGVKALTNMTIDYMEMSSRQ